jgi:hypothetical protein
MATVYTPAQIAAIDYWTASMKGEAPPVTTQAEKNTVAKTLQALPSYFNNPQSGDDYLKAVDYYASKNGNPLNDQEKKALSYLFDLNNKAQYVSEGLDVMGANNPEQLPWNIANEYRENTASLYQTAIDEAVWMLIQPGSDPSLKNKFESIAAAGIQNGYINQDWLAKDIVDNTQKYVDIQKQIAKEREPGFFDKAFSFAVNAIVGAGLTAVLGPYGAAAVKASMSIAAGVPPDKAIADGLASLASAQVPDFLRTVGLTTNNALAQDIINSSSASASKALLTGQDIKQAALTGAIGGAATNVATDVLGESKGKITAEKFPTGSTDSSSTQIGQMDPVNYGLNAREPLQPGDARFSTNVTPTGFIASGEALFTPSMVKTLTDAGYKFPRTALSDSGGVTTADKYAGDLIVPEGLRQYLPEYQPPESSSSDTQKKLSTEERSALNYALNLGFKSLFDSGGGSKTTYSSNVTTTPSQSQFTGGPGSQALGQALRIGDAGAPVFGGDKEEGKKAGWNVESLRYMGNSEA